jgi:hypothetical protein
VLCKKSERLLPPSFKVRTGTIAAGGCPDLPALPATVAQSTSLACMISDTTAAPPRCGRTATLVAHGRQRADGKAAAQPCAAKNPNWAAKNSSSPCQAPSGTGASGWTRMGFPSSCAHDPVCPDSEQDNSANGCQPPCSEMAQPHRTNRRLIICNQWRW